MKGITTPEGRQTLERFKMEAANEVGVNLKNGYNGDLTSREAGSVGGQMVNMMSTEQQWRFERVRPVNLGGNVIVYISCQVGI
ncbi:MAG: alpha/beta-type small acid-soluble spore protein [Ruminococcus sp.]|nr:alpha/beta-type small acid-soluble spore protein [Ruminococcus sp.]